MGKKEDLIGQLRPIIKNKKKLETFLIKNSNLPGPRSNLELAFAFAELCEDRATLLTWAAITEEMAGVNDPKSFPAFCAVAGLGRLYAKTGDKELLAVLKKAARDGRWRMREGVAFGLQMIGEHDFSLVQRICTEWLESAGNLEKRAILVALAHPPILTPKHAGFCFSITDTILKTLKKDNDYEVLKKGLEFTVSVFAAADPVAGFVFIEKWLGKSGEIDKIIKANLKKNRLLKLNPSEVSRLLSAR